MNIPLAVFPGTSTNLCPTKKGFTLIELLVVLAIIVILAAILFPVFSRARESARRSSCQSNLKQIALAFAQYTQDFDERFPLGRQSSGYRGNGWAGVIYPYCKNIQIWKCPSDGTTGYNPVISYGYNSAITFDTNGWTGPKIPAFTATTKTILMFEVRGATFDPNTDADYAFTPYSPAGCGYGATGNMQPVYAGDPKQSAAYATGYFPNRGSSAHFDRETPGSGQYGRHLEGANYAFVDGHVKWLRPDTISAGMAAPTPDSAEKADVSPWNAAGTNAPGRAATFSPI